MTTSESPKCWICNRHAAVDFKYEDESMTVKCRVCGNYRVSAAARGIANGSERAFLPYLAAYIRQSGVDRVDVTQAWPEQARRHGSTTLNQKIRLLLEWVANRTAFGKWVEIYADELAPFIDAIDVNEAHYLLKYLESVGYVTFSQRSVDSKDRPPDSNGVKWSIQMSVLGWQSISPVAGSGIVGTCFIAMSFAQELNDAYEIGMLPAIKEDCGFNVIRIDRVEHNDDITDRILAGIRGAQFVVADFTGQRQGVYFEAGFAAGLGRVVIWTCRSDEIDKLHFDTRQRNHITWSTPTDLREKLAQRIRATVSLSARMG